MVTYNVENSIKDISYALLYGGLLVVLFTIGSYNVNAVSGTLGGYTASVLAILFLFSLTYTNYTSKSLNNNSFSWKILSLLFVPYFILLGILGYSISIVSIYFDDIAQDRVSPYYKTFSYISLIFIMIQVYMFGKTTSKPEFMDNGTISTLSLVKLILLGLINIIVLITLFISLKYFSTDG